MKHMMKTVRIHLGLGIKKDFDVYVKVSLRQCDTLLLRGLIHFVWLPHEIINRFVVETKDMHDWEGQEPRMEVESERVELVKDLFKHILKKGSVSMSETYSRMMILNTMLSRVIKDVKKRSEFKEWKPIPRQRSSASVEV
ncbi:hypothetical protein QAD02_008302 [Eretmocerus hayati]|uniref:Uncharacterized protein n=1 Tax=Eretmocerus hayati TaxID=131215 RepID=A0ACC2N618_9HYME|nr:hypothetical protein QAD02_008302 [Eretmocerus hayati]